MVSPIGSSRQAFTSFFLFVRQVDRHFFWVDGSEEKHFDSFVRHFVAHDMPALPSKHAAYAVWSALERWDGSLWWQSSACCAFLMLSLVAWLKGCGARGPAADAAGPPNASAPTPRSPPPHPARSRLSTRTFSVRS